MTSIFGQCSAFKTRPEVSKPLRDRLFEVRPVTMSYYSRTGDLMQSILHLVFVFVLWGRLRALPPPPSTHFFPLSVFVSSLARGSCAASSSSPQFVSLSLSLSQNLSILLLSSPRKRKNFLLCFERSRKVRHIASGVERETNERALIGERRTAAKGEGTHEVRCRWEKRKGKREKREKKNR